MVFRRPVLGTRWAPSYVDVTAPVSFQETKLGNVCVHMFVSTSVYILKTLSSYQYVLPILVWSYMIHSSLTPFHICDFILWQWENCLPLPVNCLFDQINFLLLLPSPHSGRQPLPDASPHTHLSDPLRFHIPTPATVALLPMPTFLSSAELFRKGRKGKVRSPF